jgi:hypothetical protein
VLVQGTAEVDDRDLDANKERYWRDSREKLPATRDMHPPKLLRGMLGWYYMRIYIKVRPERVFVWPDADLARAPELHGSHIEEVRSGHSEEPLEEHAAGAGGETRWDRRMEELGTRHKTAALAWVAPDGFPLAVRVPVELDRERGLVTVGAQPAGLPMIEGRACLTAHRHSDQFRGQENFQVRGDLVRDDGGWALVPRRLVGGFEIPEGGAVKRWRRNVGKSFRYARTARRRLKQRSS